MSDTLVKRTAAVDLDEDFTFIGDVCKTYATADGHRVIRGVASGIAEDRDGERCSANAIRKMAATPVGAGQVPLTASHDQDWLTECGDVTKVEHDHDTDDLIVEVTLPPEGEDPIADKAWKAAHTKKLGFSIGGKLKKAYHELVERGGVMKRRKVLDEVLLRHVALTQKASYTHSFAECVAKTFTAEAPSDERAYLDADHFDDVAKAKADDEPQAAAPADDTDAAAPAATADAPGDAEPSEAAEDQEAAAQLPVARHLACPNCGHEFAAPLSADAPESRPDDENAGGEDAAKTTDPDASEPPTPMFKNFTEALEAVKAVADGDVAKTDPTPEPEVAKTDAVAKAEDQTDVMKAVAAVHQANAADVAALRSESTEGFQVIAKAVSGLIERFDALPTGRKSVARTGDGTPSALDVEKTSDDDVAKKVAEAPDPLSALKVINTARYGS